MNDYEMLFSPGGIIPVNVETTGWLVREVQRLRTENWQLKQACGYPIPADKETPQNPFKCGICDARAMTNGECDRG